jgi:conjugal transfer pilus assembly protein TraK
MRKKLQTRRTKGKTISLALLSLLLLTGSAWGGSAEEPAAAADTRGTAGQDLAQVPEAIMAALKRVNAGSGRTRASGLETAEGGTVKVEPGRNVNLTVAADQLNRLVTPFTNPVVHTVSSAKINVDGAVVYVSLAKDDGPTTMFITENGESDPSISLTLLPEAIAPREIRLAIAGGVGGVVALSGKSAKWEKSQPYTEAIEKVMLSTARGEVPPGYNLRSPVPQDPSPRCSMPVRVELRQVLEGHNFLVTVSKLTNISSLLIDEATCYQEGVRAVAVWPRVQLAAKQSAELYVVYQRDFAERPRKRPNVLQQVYTKPGKAQKVQPHHSDPEPVAVSTLLRSPGLASAHLP